MDHCPSEPQVVSQPCDLHSPGRDARGLAHEVPGARGRFEWSYDRVVEWSMNSMDWKTIFLPDTPLLEIILRGSIMYIALFVMLRVILKRQTGTLGMTDLLLITLLADAAQNAMAGEYKCLPDGIVLVASIIFWNYLFDWLSLRSEWFACVIESAPVALIRDGNRLGRN